MLIILHDQGIFIQAEWLETGGSSRKILNHTDGRIKILGHENYHIISFEYSQVLVYARVTFVKNFM
jgi:hypothetical protein